MSSDLEVDGPAPGTMLALQTIAMPADTNPAGDVFGGWLLSQMDLGGSVVARRRVPGRIATIAVKLEIWVSRAGVERAIKVTEGVFIYVSIDEHRRPCPIESR